MIIPRTRSTPSRASLVYLMVLAKCLGVLAYFGRFREQLEWLLQIALCLCQQCHIAFHVGNIPAAPPTAALYLECRTLQ